LWAINEELEERSVNNSRRTKDLTVIKWIVKCLVGSGIPINDTVPESINVDRSTVENLKEIMIKNSDLDLVEFNWNYDNATKDRSLRNFINTFKNPKQLLSKLGNYIFVRT
jgi:hypothetical protein